MNPSSTNDAKKKKKSFTVFEGLAATGLRSLRFAKELPGTLDKVIANDLSKDAVRAIELNTKYNDLEGKVVAKQGNCNVSLLLSLAEENDIKGFDIIDLDPYGTAAPFIDAAIQGSRMAVCFVSHALIPKFCVGTRTRKSALACMVVST